MKFYRQLINHEPENGQQGDCFRTCLACLMEIEPTNIPHFGENNPSDKKFWSKAREWLREQGFLLFKSYYEGDSCTLDDLFGYMKNMNPGMTYLLAGNSHHGRSHQVIALEDKIIHDPSNDPNSEIIGPDNNGLYVVSFLVSEKMHGQNGTIRFSDDR